MEDHLGRIPVARDRGFELTSRLMGIPVGIAVAAFIVAIPTVTAFSVPGVRYVLLALVAPAWFALVVGWAVWVARERPGRIALVHPAIVIVLATAVVLDLPLRARFEVSRPAFDANWYVWALYDPNGTD